MKAGYRIMTALALGICFGGTVWAAELTITADSLVYNGDSDVAQATGNVVITRDGATLTGATGEYSFADGTATLTGGIHYTKDDTTLTAASLTAYADESLLASGNVQAQAGDRVLTGDTVHYDPAAAHGTVTGSAYVSMPGTELWAREIDAYLEEIRLIGTGGIHLVNSEHGLNATSDSVVYTQTPGGDDGHAVLSGNARVNQNGNELTGPQLDIYPARRSAETTGRSTLIIRS